jgi:excinuclease UvrABC ATPase subunit
MDSLIYVLDEPTVGLHEIEKADLLEQIAALRSLGNTVIVVEHDRNTIERAQHVIDFGPLGGSDGGEIVYEGDYAGLLKSEQSFTGQYLCTQCYGKRSLDEILDVTYQGANIVDILNMSVTDAASLFQGRPAIHKMLSVLEQTGMGYIRLGQPTSTLSGGEAQRIKLAKDWVAFILGLPVRERLIGTFQYNSAASHLLSAIITRSTGKCAQDFAAENLFEPIGMDQPSTNM